MQGPWTKPVKYDDRDDLVRPKLQSLAEIRSMARINAPVLSCQPDLSKEQTQVSSGHLVGAGGIVITVQNVCRMYENKPSQNVLCVLKGHHC